MKRIILAIVAMILAMAFSYLPFAFYYLTFDPHVWDAGARVFYIYWALVAGGTAFAVGFINWKKYD